MAPHLTGDYTNMKRQFLAYVKAYEAVLDAAAYADMHNLWDPNNTTKAKVPVSNGHVGVSNGNLTNWINVYRNKKGMVHGSPGNPPSSKSN
jgi:hypothetical protein